VKAMRMKCAVPALPRTRASSLAPRSESPSDGDGVLHYPAAHTESKMLCPFVFRIPPPCARCCTTYSHLVLFSCPEFSLPRESITSSLLHSLIAASPGTQHPASRSSIHSASPVNCFSSRLPAYPLPLLASNAPTAAPAITTVHFLSTLHRFWFKHSIGVADSFSCSVHAL
jgi:hypothetical protein